MTFKTAALALASVVIPGALAPVAAQSAGGDARQQTLMEEYAAAAKKLADVQQQIAAHNAAVANQPVAPAQPSAAAPAQSGAAAEPGDKQATRLMVESVDLQKQILAALKQGGLMQPAAFDTHRLCVYEGRPYSEGASITLPSGAVQTCRRLGLLDQTNREGAPLGWEAQRR